MTDRSDPEGPRRPAQAPEQAQRLRNAGLTLAQRLAAHQPGILVLFMTGDLASAARLSEGPAPRPRLLAKPFTGPELAAAVADLLATAG